MEPRVPREFYVSLQFFILKGNDWEPVPDRVP
jgi:hypothetical protein